MTKEKYDTLQLGQSVLQLRLELSTLYVNVGSVYRKSQLLVNLQSRVTMGSGFHPFIGHKGP
jgi:hypothetical protein